LEELRAEGKLCKASLLMPVNSIDLIYEHCRCQSLDLNLSIPHWDRGNEEPVLICAGTGPEPCLCR